MSNCSLIPGLRAGFTWVYGGDGTSSKTSAMLASYHHPGSITWRWAIYWSKPHRITWRVVSWFRCSGYNRYGLTLPFIGALTLQTQPHMFRRTV